MHDCMHRRKVDGVRTVILAMDNRVCANMGFVGCRDFRKG